MATSRFWRLLLGNSSLFEVSVSNFCWKWWRTWLIDWLWECWATYMSPFAPPNLPPCGVATTPDCGVLQQIPTISSISRTSLGMRKAILVHLASATSIVLAHLCGMNMSRNGKTSTSDLPIHVAFLFLYQGPCHSAYISCPVRARWWQRSRWHQARRGDYG